MTATSKALPELSYVDRKKGVTQEAGLTGIDLSVSSLKRVKVQNKLADRSSVQRMRRLIECQA